MRRRSVLALAGAAGLAGLHTSPSFAAMSHSALHELLLSASTQGSPFGEMPDSVKFHQFSGSASADEITAFTSLIGVARETWGAKANLGGGCYEAVTGGPEILLVESGTLRISMFPTSDQKGDLPRLIRKDPKGVVQAPVFVLPNSDVELSAGEVIAFPNGSSCGTYGPPSSGPSVTYLRIYGLTSYYSSETLNHPDLDMFEQPLDLDLGISTSNPIAPTAIVLGTISIPKGSKLPLASLTTPVMFSVQSGAAKFSTSMVGAVVRRANGNNDGPSDSIPTNKATNMSAGDASYVLPNLKGDIASIGSAPLVLWIAAVVPPSPTAATPTP